MTIWLSSDYADVESDVSDTVHRESSQAESEAEHEDTVHPSKTGLADVFSKILRKKTEQKGPAVLAKGKTDREILEQKRKRARENQEGDSKAKKLRAGEEDYESEDENNQAQRLKV